jgi:hypothetical protein
MDGVAEYGMFILRCSSEEEARMIVDGEPDAHSRRAGMRDLYLDDEARSDRL